MRRKDIVFYILILTLILLFLWQWISNGSLVAKLSKLDGFANENNQLHFLSGIGPLKSTHQHADIKVYINGKAIDFSQRKYQVTTSFIHFEEGIGDVVHTHATGLTIGHLFNSLNTDLSNNCVKFEGENYCSGGSNKLKFYANGKENNEFGNYIIHDLDKILVSYGNENDLEVQKQLSSITNLAAKYSLQK